MFLNRVPILTRSHRVFKHHKCIPNHLSKFSTKQPDDKDKDNNEEDKEELGFFKKLYQNYNNRVATSEKAKKERQTQLNSEILGGTFPQFNEYHKTSGKLFRADDKLIGRDVSQIFPSITATALSGDSIAVPPSDGSVCLVGIAYNQLALKNFELWKTTYQQALGKEASLLQLTITENSLLNMFESSVTTSLKNTVDVELHGNHVPIFDQEYNVKMKDALRITNTIPVYVFLVENSNVRWRGTGEADEDELKDMIKCAEQLNNQMGSVESSSIPRWKQVGMENK